MKTYVMLPIVGLALLSAGCGIGNKAVQKALEQTAGIKVDTKNNEISMKSKDGELQLSDSGKLPDGFPFPVLSGAKLESSVKTVGNKEDYYVLNFSTTKDIEEISSFYEAAYKDKGIEPQKTEVNDGSGTSMAMILGASDKLEVSIQIMNGGDKEPNYINITLKQNK